MSEAEFQAQVIQYARLRGWKCAHFRRVRVQRKNGSVYYETPVAADGKGFPDLILVRGKAGVAAELKVGKNRLSPEQRAWGTALAWAGFRWVVWRPTDWPKIEEVLT